jgi:UDP:flavonoid glycosyltransferase YjiC (YdhE family)
LSHPAIGGCLFHSGWGSIIESLGLGHGHPQILLPMVLDQNLNAKLLVEKGIGLEVQRNPDGSFDRNAIAKSTRMVMVDREGEALRLKAAQMQGVFANQGLLRTT